MAPHQVLLEEVEHVSVHAVEGALVVLRHTLDVRALWVHFELAVPQLGA